MSNDVVFITRSCARTKETIDVEGVDVTFGYRSFFGDDGVADEKSAIVSLTKSF